MNPTPEQREDTQAAVRQATNTALSAFLAQHEQRADLSALLTVNQACGQFQISRPTLYQLIHTGELRSVLIGRARRIPATEIDRFIEARLTAGAS